MDVKKNVSLDKMSKKTRREYYARKRGSWNGINPAMRVMPNKKRYNRRRDKKAGCIF